MKPLHHQSAADSGLSHVQTVDVELVVVLRIGDRRLQDLLDLLGDTPLGEGQVGHCRLSALAPDQLGDEVELTGRRPDHLTECHRFVFGDARRIGCLAHDYFLFDFLSAAWP